MESCEASSWYTHNSPENCYISSSCPIERDEVVYYGTVRNEKNAPVGFHKNGCCCQSTCRDTEKAECCYSKDPCDLETDILDETDILGFENFFLESWQIQRVTKDWYCFDDYNLSENAELIPEAECDFGNGLVQNVTNFFDFVTNESGKNQLLWRGIDDLACWSSLGGPRFRIKLATIDCFVYAEILVLPSAEKGPFIKATYADDLSKAEVVDGLSAPISYWTHSGVNLHSG